MNLRHHIYSLVAATLLFSGCSDDPFNKYHSSEDGMISMRIQLNTPPEVSITTRSTDTTDPSNDEKKLEKAVVMVFDGVTGDPVLLQVPVKVTMNTSSSTATAELYAQSGVYLCVVANLSDDQITTLTSLDTGAKLSSIRTMLQRDLDKSEESIGIDYPLPMSGWSAPTNISSSTGSITVNLSRSVARIDVDGTAETTETENKNDFIVTGIRIANGAPSGYLLPQSTLPLWDATDVVTYSLVDNGTDQTKLEGKAYCFENKGLIGDTPNPTRVVVRGHSSGTSTDTWYPIDIIYEQTTSTESGSVTKKCYDIERNKIYTIKLKNVKKTGYGSFEQAAKSEAFNTMLDTEITVTDPYAYDITTNGRQYMGVTNAEFVIYPKDNTTATITNVHVTTLSYTSDPNWSDGSITCNEGITLSAGAYPRLNVRGDAEASYRDIVVDITPSKLKDNSGLITLQIGNLLKEIKVRVGDVTPKVGTVVTDYYIQADNDEKDFKVGEIISPSDDTSWIKVSSLKENTYNSSLNDKVTNPDGGIYLHVEPNVGFETSATPREASAYIAGEKDNQRIKVTVQQDSYDVYYGNLQLQPYTYVGTFHRWNQTGERLIRIDASHPGGSSTGIGWWEATVVAGREFIVLDTEITKDSRVHIYKSSDSSQPNPYGEGDDDSGFPSDLDDNYVEQYQVDSKLRTVNGKESYIYFRVGLTGKLSGPSAQPRYGLITISYGYREGVTVGTHNIYVRQGEAADYLMRPWDPGTTPKTGINAGTNDFPSGTRPLATKLAVCNLTDPTPDETTKNSVDRGTRGYAFTQYPSQGGFFFPVSGTEAIDPRAADNSKYVTSPPSYENDNWNNAWETCPKGYRRPHDGKARATNANQNDSDIKNSEIRQSLWLFPLKGMERSDFSNQLTGYLADGYFDRHHIIKIKNEGSDPSDPIGIVRSGHVAAAYRGYLIFNPHNYASIFLSFSGFYNAGILPYKCGHFGGEGYINTKTNGGGGNNWVVAFGFISSGGRDQYVFDNYSSTSNKSGYPIRCIKDELPPAISDNTGVKPPVEDDNKPMVANFTYDSNNTEGNNLKTAIEKEYTADDRKRINTLALNVVNALTNDDFIFLNNWASQSGDYNDCQLKHLVIRGYYYQTLQAGAFTSSNWNTISLIDIRKITDSAFSNGLTGLTNLSLSYLDGIEANAASFGFDTSQVQLHLGGKDYDVADLTNRTWKGKTWKAIKQY